MRYKSPAITILLTAVLNSWASAGIPEPSAVLYGTITVGGQPVTAAESVTVVARVDGIAEPIGSYTMGDNTPAGDNYALHIRLETVPAGTQPSGNAAQVGQTVHILLRREVGCEVEADTYVVTSRGTVLERNLSVASIPSDPNSCSCGTGRVTFVDPPNGVIDARQPADPTAPSVAQGIDTIKVQGPEGFASSNCRERWSLCETDVAGSPNTIAGIVDNGDGTFSVTLARKITPGATTTLTYNDGVAPSVGVFNSLPGDVDANGTSSAQDILVIIDILNGTAVSTWGNYSCDVDQTGVCGASDILRTIDMLNGAMGTTEWLGRTVPGGCP